MPLKSLRRPEIDKYPTCLASLEYYIDLLVKFR